MDYNNYTSDALLMFNFISYLYLVVYQSYQIILRNLYNSYYRTNILIRIKIPSTHYFSNPVEVLNFMFSKNLILTFFAGSISYFVISKLLLFHHVQSLKICGLRTANTIIINILSTHVNQIISMYSTLMRVC